MTHIWKSQNKANTPEFSLKEEKGLNNPEFQQNNTRLA